MTHSKLQLTNEQQATAQKHLDEHFYKFKKQFKSYSKNALVTIIWQQALNYESLKQISQELHQENKKLKNQDTAPLSKEETNA